MLFSYQQRSRFNKSISRKLLQTIQMQIIANENRFHDANLMKILLVEVLIEIIVKLFASWFESTVLVWGFWSRQILMLEISIHVLCLQHIFQERKWLIHSRKISAWSIKISIKLSDNYQTIPSVFFSPCQLIIFQLYYFRNTKFISSQRIFYLRMFTIYISHFHVPS